MAKDKKADTEFVKRVKYEIDFIGLRDKDSDYEGALGEAVVELAETFSRQGHSGFSAEYAAGIFYTLVQGKALTPVTNEPAEWIEVTKEVFTPVQIKEGQKIWQNTRDISVFSRDGGKTWENMRDKTKGESLTREQALYGIDEGTEPSEDSGTNNITDEKVSESTTRDSGKDERAEESRATNGGEPSTEPAPKKTNSKRKKSKNLERSQQTVAKSKPADV